MNIFGYKVIDRREGRPICFLEVDLFAFLEIDLFVFLYVTAVYIGYECL